MENTSDEEGSGLELVDVSDVLDYLGDFCLFYKVSTIFPFQE